MDHYKDNKKLIEITDKKRLGILRTFHHKLYEEPEETEGNLIKSCCYFYCVHNRGASLIITISFIVIIIGILSIIYGSMIPSISQEKGNKEKTVYSKELFIICGISILSFGVVASLFGFVIPLYTSTYKKIEDDGNQTPIIVDYELPPYQASVHSNDTFLYSEDSSTATSNCPSPLSDEHFQTLYVQKGP